MSVHDQIIVLKCAQRNAQEAPPRVLRVETLLAYRSLSTSSYPRRERGGERRSETIFVVMVVGVSRSLSVGVPRLFVHSFVPSFPCQDREENAGAGLVFATWYTPAEERPKRREKKRREERRGPPVCAVAVYTGYKIRCLGRLSACSRLCL